MVLAAGCGHLHQPGPPADAAWYRPFGGEDPQARRWAPAFYVHGFGQTHNRIGGPTARVDDLGEVSIIMDPSRPVLYWERREFATARGRYVNLIYRVHFPGTPPSIVPFFIGAGLNNGLMMVVTLDAGGLPVLVTTVGTCGCYAANLPTDHTPAWALPEGWSGRPLAIYGETLPARLDLGRAADARLVVEVRPGEHRVMGLGAARDEAADRRPGAYLAGLPLAPMADLYRLPLPGGGSTSLFIAEGPAAGHVKGAWKPWETLILGLPSLDLLVGMDKAYGLDDNPFYTSLQPWYRRESDMNDFPRFLAFHGWRL